VERLEMEVAPGKSFNAEEGSGEQLGIVRPLIRIFISSILAGLFILVAQGALSTRYSNGYRIAGMWSQTFLVTALGLACTVLIAGIAIYHFRGKWMRFLGDDALLQSSFLERIDEKYLDAAVVCSAALSLFLELAMIRWLSSVLPVLAFYKNFSLLACFAGLGIGYALANRERIPLVLVAPLLSWQFAFLLAIKSLPNILDIVPFREQHSMGLSGGSLSLIVVLYALLTVVFLVTALTFIPIGQVCGRLMERRRSTLRAYGLNLVGSLIGVLLMMIVSFFWTPPLVWFALCFLGLLTFHVRRTVSLFVGFISAVTATIVLAWWPVDPLWNRVYSPYQLLEIGTQPDTGLTLIRAAGHYYQKIYNLSANKGLSVAEQHVRDYYDFPYQFHPTLDNVAVVGAGTGNDVAAALRAGAGNVDAVEIDPAIILAGKMNHPENPYGSTRTRVINDDARTFLRNTTQSYDVIAYGLLDSHTLLSHGSSVRLDSFVYTVEGLREARNRLKSDGVISLAFTVVSDELGRKLYLMLQQVFDGRPPICVEAIYDRAVIFVESNNPAADFSLTNLPAGFKDRTSYYADPNLQASVSTDDWPFFYMPHRIYPWSYLIMIVQILALSLFLGVNFFEEGLEFGYISFFFLGAGFMLIETKGITEMGLTFGNTWQVIGAMISGVLIMAFLGNCVVSWFHVKRPLLPYFGLGIAIVIGWVTAGSGGFQSTLIGRIETAAVLTSPLFFSGMVFSTLLASRKQISGVLAMNLLGAICGGLLEYNSMYFGFRWLYPAALFCYALAFISDQLLMTLGGIGQTRLRLPSIIRS
jgi:spermidine synthase